MKPQSKKIKVFVLGFLKDVKLLQCTHMNLIYVNIFKIKFLIFIKNTKNSYVSLKAYVRGEP